MLANHPVHGPGDLAMLSIPHRGSTATGPACRQAAHYPTILFGQSTRLRRADGGVLLNRDYFGDFGHFLF